MITAFRRLILISLVTLFIIALGLGVLRGLGLLQGFSKLAHSLTQQKIHITFKTEDLKTQSKKNQTILGISIHWDKQWKIKGSNLPLTEYLPSHPTQSLFVDIQFPDPYYLKSLFPLLEKFEDRVILATPHPAIFQSARKQKPEWLFTANQIKWTQLRIIASFFLETVAVTKEDIFIVSEKDLLEQPNLQRVLNELRRRKKILLFQNTGSEPKKAPEWADGTFRMGS